MVVPRSVSATGVPWSRPATSRSPSALLSVSGVPSTTTVTLSAVERVQSTLVPPLTTCSDGELADVSGTPAYVGTALTALTPGTTSNLIPALWQARASSDRPLNMDGSPSMSRTTTPLPLTAPAVLAALTSSLARDAWVSGCPCSPCPASMTTTSGRLWLATNSSRLTWSMTTTSASARYSTARTVIRPGSPGPAPTKATRPG